MKKKSCMSEKIQLQIPDRKIESLGKYRFLTRNKGLENHSKGKQPNCKKHIFIDVGKSFISISCKIP